MRTVLSSLEFKTSSDPKEILVFLAGFPDNETSGWGNFLELLKQRKDVQIICICLPDLEDDAVHRPWGYSFDEITLLLDATINQHVPDRKKKVNLIIHDWGSFCGFIYENRFPDRVKSVTAFDVGIIRRPRTIKESLLVVLYQWWFAAAYVTSQLFGLSMGSMVLAVYILFIPNSFKIATSFPRDKSKVNVTMMYPYYHFWRNYFFDSKNLPVPKFPSCPVLFMVS
jgi:pimeloyl-ACP methyl ester carboxylesterase